MKNVDTLGNVTTATRPSSSVAADTLKILDNAGASMSKPSNDTQNAARPSSSTARKTGVENQNTPETEGRDEACKMSKTEKKKREGRKRTDARAKEAAANVEDTVGNNDDEDDDLYAASGKTFSSRKRSPTRK